MGTDNFILGDYNAVCFECGRKFKASQLVENWKGYMVCPKHWEPRHPQDFVGGVPGTDAPAWTQPLQMEFVGPVPDFPPYDPNNP